MRWIVLVAGVALAAPATAAASGGGLGATFGGPGATAPGGEFAYVTVPAHRRTVIQKVRRAGGAVDLWRVLKGAYGVPSAAYDGSTTGLSADGRTLVLAEVARTYPPERTNLLILTDTLREQKRLSLPGYYSVDAISPDGRLIYLVRYTAPVRDITRYEVVVYDLDHPGPPEVIVDPAEPEERMGGTPYSRAISPDGRWVYTFYAAPEPFIHALDTVGRTAKCIDLPQFAGQDVSALRVGLFDGEVRLMRGARTMARVAPSARVAQVVPVAMREARQSGSNTPWALAAIPALALLVWTARAWRRRRVGTA